MHYYLALRAHRKNIWLKVLRKGKLKCVLHRKAKVPVGNYMFKVNNRNTRTRLETCSKLTIKAP